MSKFKVGQKVRILDSNASGALVGETGIVVNTWPSANGYEVYDVQVNNRTWSFQAAHLALVMTLGQSVSFTGGQLSPSFNLPPGHVIANGATTTKNTAWDPSLVWSGFYGDSATASTTEDPPAYDYAEQQKKKWRADGCCEECGTLRPMSAMGLLACTACKPKAVAQ